MSSEATVARTRAMKFEDLARHTIPGSQDRQHSGTLEASDRKKSRASALELQAIPTPKALEAEFSW